jgi:hypothetical protein
LSSDTSRRLTANAARQERERSESAGAHDLASSAAGEKAQRAAKTNAGGNAV